ncbi:MAG: hypothetical protein QF659_06920, partial [Dehalococcoidia bacterium]|nr:hypothetical protein [Dehalococcoidia bacterium]
RELIRVLRHEIDAKDQPIVSKDRQIEQLHLFLQQAMRAPSLPGQNWDSGPSTVDSMLDE